MEESQVIYFGPKDEEVNVTHKYIVIYDEETDTSDVDLVDDYDIEEVYSYRVEQEPAEDMTKKLKFLKQHIPLNTVKKGTKIELIYPYEGDASVIERIKPGCNCTVNLSIDPINHVLKGVFDSNTVDGSFSKTISVFFKDGVDMEIKNSLGVLVENPSKSKVKLTFNGVVK